MTFDQAQVIREKQLCGYAYPAATLKEAIYAIQIGIALQLKPANAFKAKGRKPRAVTGKPAGRPKTGQAPRPSRAVQRARRSEKLAAQALL